MLKSLKMQVGHSPEVGPLQILHVLFLLGNGQAPSDIPSDTKISIRWVQKLSFLKNLNFTNLSVIYVVLKISP